MRRRIIYGGAAAVAACLSLSYYARAEVATPQVVTKQVTRGDIVQTVTASGTLETVMSVEVGTQVSGTIMALYVDFNSIVRKGQVVARLDPAVFEIEVQQARANLIRAQADTERLQVTAEDAGTKLSRAQELSEKRLISAVDLETAVLAKRTADAQVRSAQAGIIQAEASLRQAEVDLSKTIITAPIDGIVIARNVDVGQTVASSISAPTLLVIAGDLSQMRLSASIDESDVGTIKTGQPATFRVGAFPGEEFSGTVHELRLNPVVEQNVVTYAAIIDVPNTDLKLKPGMTATVTIETETRRSVLRIPNAALQFRPTADPLLVLKKNGQTAGAREGSGVRQVWTQVAGTFAQVPVKTGLSDGSVTEVTSANLDVGTAVVTSVTSGLEEARSGATAGTNPFSNLQGRPAGMAPGNARRQ